ncbi:hypothetical protein ASC66_04195 [Leifsonia sp. Root4]|uniref:DUF4238 domain-containing protein n=1 Tax=Leifsonia sp. Root4 TaxID=1736525 RepID=UPI0006F1F4CB|nr:DUF4238 domain-containing protein [Leifsonia sp. Root4]KQW08142.1 hypothetical protein ASC66_04195 [Leifsonia sp. Root4]
MAGIESTKKLHHYVPQAYLRGFANAKDRVTAIRLPGSSEPFTTSVRNVAAQTHFHRVEGLERPDEFEDVLAVTEGEAQSVIRKLEQHNPFPLPEGDRWTLAYFIALQAVRGPDTRRTAEQIQAKMIRLEVGAGGRNNVKAWIKKNFGFDATDAQAERIWVEATHPDGPPITFSNLAHIQHMVEAAAQLVPYIAGRPWSLTRFRRRSLITSDAPVALIGNPEVEPWEGVGFGTAWGIAFPLTRKLGLLMSDPTVIADAFAPDSPRHQEIAKSIREGKMDRVQQGTTSLERLFNDHVAASAREWIYRHPDDASYVPSDLHDPTLINIEMRGASDIAFDGTPWFERSSEMTPAVATQL